MLGRLSPVIIRAPNKEIPLYKQCFSPPVALHRFLSGGSWWSNLLQCSFYPFFFNLSSYTWYILFSFCFHSLSACIYSNLLQNWSEKYKLWVWNTGWIKKNQMYCLSSCWVRHTILHVNTLSSLNVHSALALRSPASPTLGNLSAVLFPLTGGTTTSFPALALCSARWANTHIHICTQEKTHTHRQTHTHTPLPLHDNFLSILLSHTFCPQASGVSEERSSAVILIQPGPIFDKYPNLWVAGWTLLGWTEICNLTVFDEDVQTLDCFIFISVFLLLI